MKLTLTITIEVPDNATVNTTGNGLDINIEKAVKEFKVPPLIQQCPPPDEMKMVKFDPFTEPVKLPIKDIVSVPVSDVVLNGTEKYSGRKCIICGAYFKPVSSEKTCSEPCRKIHHRNMQKIYNERYEAKKKAQQSDPKPVVQSIPEHHERKTVVLKSGEQLCAHCKEPFKIQKFAQHFCSDSCEALHGKKEHSTAK